MTPLEVYIIRRKQVEHLTSTPPVPQGDLDNYLSLRPGILDDGHCDIFQPNVRSAVQAHTEFDLFEIVDRFEYGALRVRNLRAVVVLPFWLELFENFGLRHLIKRCIDWLKETFPVNPVVIQWNHDRDAATVPELQGLPSNFFVLNFNTSRPTPNDILLPFWTIETRQTWNPSDSRPIRGGFIGFVGSVEVRQKMRYGFAGRRGWEILATEREGRVPQEEYLRRMGQWDFALCPRGGGLGSYRTMEAIQCGTIPVMFTDDLARPYPDLKWDFSFTIPEKDAGNFELVTEILSHHDVKELRQRLAGVRERFTLAGVQQTIHKRISDYLS